MCVHNLYDYRRSGVFPSMSYNGTVCYNHGVCSCVQVTRIVLLWVNNHFNDFEGDLAMTRFLEDFEKLLEATVIPFNLPHCHPITLHHRFLTLTTEILLEI